MLGRVDYTHGNAFQKGKKTLTRLFVRHELESTRMVYGWSMRQTAAVYWCNAGEIQWRNIVDLDKNWCSALFNSWYCLEMGWHFSSHCLGQQAGSAWSPLCVHVGKAKQEPHDSRSKSTAWGTLAARLLKEHKRVLWTKKCLPLKSLHTEGSPH